MHHRIHVRAFKLHDHLLSSITALSSPPPSPQFPSILRLRSRTVPHLHASHHCSTTTASCPTHVSLSKFVRVMHTNHRPPYPFNTHIHRRCPSSSIALIMALAFSNALHIFAHSVSFVRSRIVRSTTRQAGIASRG
ncbi:hypothetical protein K466DRAFT_135343 [Polyporus arcularius HHB13444]|uniref:Uncharacterized protein n=1 Tax=Polyporus arcularius HHB13444 TaxID=1314778 RepID=A0A5C3PD53_9APHY|nr:hypothetical protein K466DRAFT_135343 [Polyporus arcularius HHB13444]